MNWSDIFDYKDGVLYWKIRTSNRISIGDPAGSLYPTGYYTVSYLSRDYQVHRIIWEMHNVPIPKGYFVDHKNGDKTDNRLENLRLANNQQNCMNRGKTRRSTTGIKGVYFDKKNNKFYTQIIHKGKFIWLGKYLTAEEAREVYEAKARELQGEFFYKNNIEAD